MEAMEEILRTLMGILRLLIGFAIMIAIVAVPIKAIIHHIKKGMALEDVYTTWTILTVILLIFLRTYGIVSLIAEIITYIIARNKMKDKKENGQKTHGYTPSPGSNAHYEQWKAEREREKQE